MGWTPGEAVEKAGKALPHWGDHKPKQNGPHPGQSSYPAYQPPSDEETQKIAAILIERANQKKAGANVVH